MGSSMAERRGKEGGGGEQLKKKKNFSQLRGERSLRFGLVPLRT